MIEQYKDNQEFSPEQQLKQDIQQATSEILTLFGDGAQSDIKKLLNKTDVHLAKSIIDNSHNIKSRLENSQPKNNIERTLKNIIIMMLQEEARQSKPNHGKPAKTRADFYKRSLSSELNKILSTHIVNPENVTSILARLNILLDNQLSLMPPNSIDNAAEAA